MQNKILFITHWYPTAEHPGKGIFIKRHAEAISVLKPMDLVHFDVRFSRHLLQVKLTKERFADDNFDTYSVKVHSRFYKLIYYLLPFQFLLLQKLLKKFALNPGDYQLIHSNVIFPNGIIAYWLSKKYNIPQVHSEHWSKIKPFFTKGLYKNEGLKAFENVKSVLAVSALLKKELLPFTEENKIRIVPNIIDRKNFYYQKKERASGAPIRFLCAAQWEKPKNPFYFLEALKNIQTNFELTILGNGSQVEEVRSRKYPFKINYADRVDSKRICDFFHQSDFFLHGSDYETFSVVIVEALYTGTPVIVSDIGIAGEVVDAKNGLICRNTVEDWELNIKKAIATEYSHKQIARSIQGKYDAAVIGGEINEIYTSIVS